MLLENPPFILREPQNERRGIEIIADFPFMLSLVEAFMGFFQQNPYWSITRPIDRGNDELRRRAVKMSWTILKI